MINKWSVRFLDLAKQLALWSKDSSTGVGAVITKSNRIVSQGFNGYPQKVVDRDEPREIKLKKTIHAEENCLLFAKQDVEGCTIYVWPMPPCANCAAKIIQAGISRVIAPKPTPELESRWGADFAIAKQMYREAEVKFVEVIDGNL